MKTYKFKLYNSKRNKYLHRQIDLSCEIYNHCIALHKRYYRLYNKHLHVYHLQKHITKLKKLPRYSHWKHLDSQAIQDIAERIDRGYKLFFRNLTAGIKTAPPSFKKRCKYKSFTYKRTGHKLLGGNAVRMGKRVYKYFKSREIDGNIKLLTVKRDSLGDLYLFFTTDTVESKESARTGKIVGFDFGLKTYLTASDGNDIQSPLFFQQCIGEMWKASRNLSRKRCGSNNRRKARLNVARLHRKIQNRRNDFHWKLAHDLTDRYDVICFETLNLKGMKRLWGRKISDLGFAAFIAILKYVAEAKDKTLVFIDQWEPTSKTCASCGYINKDLALSDRSWLCPECKTNHDRDRNASYNILRVGASTLGLGDVRPSGSLCLIPESHTPVT